MPDADAGHPLTRVRRRDRAVDDPTWIAAFLRRAALGVVASARDGQPYAVMRNFAFDEAAHAIYLHGARAGRTFDNAAHDNRVCFTAGEMGRLMPAKRAAAFGVEYAGVVVFGRMTLVDDPAEAKHGLQLLLDKYFPDLQPGRDYEPAADEDLEVTAVFRIDIEAWSGKRKTAPDT